MLSTVPLNEMESNAFFLEKNNGLLHCKRSGTGSGVRRGNPGRPPLQFYALKGGHSPIDGSKCPFLVR